MADLDVLEAPSVIEEALSRAASQLAAPRHGEAAQWQTRLSTLEPHVKNLAEAITGGRDIPVLVTTLKAKEGPPRMAEDAQGDSSKARMLLQQWVPCHMNWRPRWDSQICGSGNWPGLVDSASRRSVQHEVYNFGQRL